MWIEESEQKMISDMCTTVETIRHMRKYPKEKDVCLSYLDKYTDRTRFTPAKNYTEYFHEFNPFTPARTALSNHKSSAVSRCTKSRMTTM